ncbi:MAG TPA: biliverdin-producing heme oxygenase [Verrucomicrobiae bacterium]|nr:biliverdin-producing heme oxygenase [Verrucomicrobiae bacterium]
MILKRLRNETIQHHDALERQLPVLSALFTLEDYRQLLARFYGYYKPLEERLTLAARRENAFYEQDRRCKSQFLEQDLMVLDVSTIRDLKQMPRCEKLPLLENIPQLLGCLYVLEGATLGGQMIASHLQKNFGLTPQTGTAFYYGHGEETARRWQVFGGGLKAEAQKANADDEIVESANRTFETMSHWLFPKTED